MPVISLQNRRPHRCSHLEKLYPWRSSDRCCSSQYERKARLSSGAWDTGRAALYRALPDARACDAQRLLLTSLHHCDPARRTGRWRSRCSLIQCCRMGSEAWAITRIMCATSLSSLCVSIIWPVAMSTVRNQERVPCRQSSPFGRRIYSVCMGTAGDVRSSACALPGPFVQ